MDIKKIKLLIALLVLSPSALAFDIKNGDAVIQFGNFWSSPGYAQDIYIKGLVGNQYTYNSSKQNISTGLVGLGYYVDGFFREQFFVKYGINAFYLANTTVTGTIIQEHLYPNLAYSYAVTNYPIYLAAKAQVDKSTQYNMTVDLGIGPNIVQTSQYKERSLDQITIPSKTFTPNTAAVFSFTAGAGIKINNVFGSVPLECGYRFFYLGHSTFNKSTDQITNTLRTGNTHANAVICGLTF